MLSNKVKEGEGEAAAGSCESLALAGDGEVLAGEAACPEGGIAIAGAQPILWTVEPIFSGGLVLSLGAWSRLVVGSNAQTRDVTDVDDSRPSLGEDGAGVGVDLAD